jgi:hypothetical protein
LLDALALARLIEDDKKSKKGKHGAKKQNDNCYERLGIVAISVQDFGSSGALGLQVCLRAVRLCLLRQSRI